VKQFLLRLAHEPPFRIVARAILKRMNVSVETRAHWELSLRPPYLIGLVEAANQANQQGHEEICAIEFGVAGGAGLLAMQEEAAAVEREKGVKIRVYGFDLGAKGLPSFIGDYRDHPDAWKPGDFKMDEERLRSHLTDRTTLILGNVNETASRFFEDQNPPPVGFISIDLDLYSSTRDALTIFDSPKLKMLWNTPVYFDDIEFIFNHRFAGELLAIEEFNLRNRRVKIDRWYGVEANRPFPERLIYQKLYVAHDLDAISQASLARESVSLPMRERGPK